MNNPSFGPRTYLVATIAAALIAKDPLPSDPSILAWTAVTIADALLDRMGKPPEHKE